jgi:predicted MFS family arabinose efflux permease
MLTVTRAAIPPLIQKVGFGWTMRVVAFLYLFLLSISIATVKSRLVHRPSKLHVQDVAGPLRETAVVKLALAALFFFLGVFLPYNFLVVEAIDHGMSSSRANDLLVILSTTRCANETALTSL